MERMEFVRRDAPLGFESASASWRLKKASMEKTLPVDLDIASLPSIIMPLCTQ